MVAMLGIVNSMANLPKGRGENLAAVTVINL